MSSAERLCPRDPKNHHLLLLCPAKLASEPLPHPLKRARCDRQPSTSGGLTSTVPLSLPRRRLHTGAVLLSTLNTRSHHPVRHRPFQRNRSPGEEGRDTRRLVELTWWSARDFCGVVNGGLCAFLGPTHFSVHRRTSHSALLPVL